MGKPFEVGDRVKWIGVGADETYEGSVLGIVEVWAQVAWDEAPDAPSTVPLRLIERAA